MADWRYFEPAFWHDDYIMNLNYKEKFVYSYLFTNTYCNQAGVYNLPLKLVCIELDLPQEEIEQILRKFETDGKIEMFDGLIWVKNFLKHQPHQNPSVWQRIIKDLKRMAMNSNTLITRYIQHVNTLPIQIPTELNSLVTGCQHPVDTIIRRVKGTVTVKGKVKGEKIAPDDKNPPKPPVITLNFESQKWENINPKDIDTWKETYPACDVPGELLKAAQWIISNPTKRKKNYRRYITNWLARTQERGGSRGSGPSAAERRLEELKKGGKNERD